MRKKKFSVHEFSCMRGRKKIVGKYFLPESYQGGKLAVVIISHGFLVNMSTTRTYAEEIAGWGFASVIFDFCGGGLGSKSDGPTTEMTVFTEMEDLEAVIDYVQRQEFADAKKLTLMGCSQGSFVSAMLAAKWKSRIAGLVLFYPALCIPDGAREGSMMFAQFDPQNIPDKMRCGPIEIGHDYPACVLEVDAFEAIKGYEGPVCILHGDRDQVVDVNYAKKAYEQYLGEKRPNGRVQLHIISGADHGFKGKKNRVAMMLVQEFMKNNVPVLCLDMEIIRHRRTYRPGRIHDSLAFKGKADGQYFTGVLEEDASEERDYRIGGGRRFCADYTVRGRDYTGRECSIHIVNRCSGKEWVSEVSTDSEALTFLNQNACRCVSESRKEGQIVRLFCDRDEN